MGMETRAEILHRRIAHHRDCLRAGVDSELARRYLRHIAEAEAELARIDEQRQKDPCRAE